MKAAQGRPNDGGGERRRASDGASEQASGRLRAIDEGGPRPPIIFERATSGGSRTTVRSTGDGKRSTKAAEGRELVPRARASPLDRPFARSLARACARLPPYLHVLL